MTPEEVLQAAKQGNPGAIAALMNRSLQPKGITARITVSGDCLTVVVESQEPPQQKPLIDFLRKGLTSLHLATVTRVVVQGRTIGKSAPVWREAFSLSPDTKIASETKNSLSPLKATSPEAGSTISSKTLSFVKTRNGERVLLVGATFLITSFAWMGAVFLHSGSNGSSGGSSIPFLSKPTPPPEAGAAIDALQKINVKTEVGINQLDYSDLVANAKFAIDKYQALPDVKNHQAFSQGLSEALQTHLLGLEFFKECYSSENSFNCNDNSPALKAVIAKYPDITSNSSISQGWGDGSAKIWSTQGVLSVIWQKAKENTDKASKSLSSN